MNLQTLTEHLRPPAPGFQCQLTGVSYDSRTVQPGHVFVAIKGTHVDGHDYIANAIERGATVVVHQDEVNEVTGVEYVRVPDSRVALSPLAAAWYGTPASNIRVVGVTGTKGKTTTSTLCAHVLDADGRRSGLITTAQFKVADRWWDNTTRQTTPEALEVHALLREMVLARCDYAVVEASSHALSPNWNRLGDAQFDVAVFTNVTHEHLDYHGTVEQYRRDKARLFEMLSAPSSHGGVHKQRKLAVVNLDDPHAALYLEAAGPTVEHLTYAIEHPHALVRAADVALTRDGATYTATTPWGSVDVRLNLPGMFNVHNSLAALAVGAAEGLSLHACAEALGRVGGVTGRMERVEQGQPYTVIVDYAHNPDSFEKLFEMLRPLTDGQLIAVFGSAGERDRQKRPIQGRIAAHYCDFVVLTDEDPRDEDRDAIIDQIAQGARAAGKREGDDFIRVPDRRQAIDVALDHAHPGDIVVLLGKGHESCIYYENGHKMPWNERAEAEDALRRRGYST